MNLRSRIEKTTGRIATLTAALLLSSAGIQTAHAQSAWSRLAQMISSDTQPAASVPQQPEMSVAQPAMPDGFGEVPDEMRLAALNTPPAAVGITASEPRDQFGKQMDLGLESEDTAALQARTVMNTPEMLRLLGENPRFTYDATGLQDPMLVPWARNAAIFKELSEQAEALMSEGELDRAAEVYQRILALNDSRYTMLATAKLTEIAGRQNAVALEVLAQQEVVVELPPELPIWVQENTTAVIVSSDSPICMVGEYMLTVGETLPNYPEVKVASIEDDRVFYQVRNQTFEVELTNR